ncbi:TIGR02647 family protein [Oceanisphaera marina]|uniref:TIGR02647 family protein n=1 Tax=Oceanisphaera marina TaxID=2017550 RepID=A0ABQ1IPI9_9GAMM|nr:TIGR02647 family protein [Oceanisphaera marina]GGB47867.1 TIGR02647 family protein [Oceanisphaera marina]
MRYHPDLLNELNFLLNFNLDTTQQGLKVHKNADPEVIAAAKSLHEKGLITMNDGGYLTDLGREASEHAQALLTLLREPQTA